MVFERYCYGYVMNERVFMLYSKGDFCEIIQVGLYVLLNR